MIKNVRHWYRVILCIQTRDSIGDINIIIKEGGITELDILESISNNTEASHKITKIVEDSDTLSYELKTERYYSFEV